MSTSLDYFLRRASTEEGKRRFAYNDATGKTVTCKTMVPPGNLSIGIGINLEVGLDDEEITWLLEHRATPVFTQIQTYYWWKPDEPIRGSVLLDIGFNGGLADLLHYPKMLAAYSVENWVEASNQCTVADEKLDASRYAPLRKILLTGLETPP